MCDHLGKSISPAGSSPDNYSISIVDVPILSGIGLGQTDFIGAMISLQGQDIVIFQNAKLLH